MKRTETLPPPPSQNADTIFAQLLQDLPPESGELAREFKAFERARKIKTPEQLLRVVLMFAALDYSERQIAGNLSLVDPRIGRIADQSVHDRLAGCLPWLQALLPKMIGERMPPWPSGLRLLALDASDLTAPGQRKPTWRLHVLMDLVRVQLVGVQLSDAHTGETLVNFEFEKGDAVMCDRGYSHRRGIAHLIESGGEAIVRYNPHLIPITDRAGRALDLAVALSDCPHGERRSFAVQFTAPDGKIYPVWVHAYHLSPEAAQEARRRCRQLGKKRKYTPRQSTLFLSEFVMVLTTIAPEVVSPQAIIELYRCRWQIELLFKRYKSLLDFDCLRARAASPLGAVYLHGKLLYACLIERRGLSRCGPGWTQLDGQRRGTWWRVWKLLQDEIAPLISLAQCWNLGAWPAALIALAERKRKRRLQALPTEVITWLNHAPSVTAPS